MLVKIGLYGCDDSTIFEFNVSDTEYELFQRISQKSDEISNCICMPTMEVSRVDNNA